LNIAEPTYRAYERGENIPPLVVSLKIAKALKRDPVELFSYLLSLDCVEVKENFLEKKYFESLQKLVLGDNFAWYYSDGVSYKEDSYFQFVHTLYTKNREYSGHYQTIIPLLAALDAQAVRAVKFNLLTKTSKIVEHGYHIDMEGNTTAIMYMNTCNGYTKFENGKIVKSEANKVVVFPSDLRHTGTSCTNEKMRVVLNLNYYR
jgi:transcriptional regulator with XRE-family HTH domain